MLALKGLYLLIPETYRDWGDCERLAETVRLGGGGGGTVRDPETLRD